METLKAQQLIDSLGLEKHIEGGYFKETFRSTSPDVNTSAGKRDCLTSIYYLLTTDSPVGHFHLNRSSIVHYFHGGDPIRYFMIDEQGQLNTCLMGPDPTQGHQLQLIVQGGIWKASELCSQGQFGYGLIGEAVSPGFDYQDMTLGKRQQLLARFGQHQSEIERLTRQ